MNVEGLFQDLLRAQGQITALIEQAKESSVRMVMLETQVSALTADHPRKTEIQQAALEAAALSRAQLGLRIAVGKLDAGLLAPPYSPGSSGSAPD